MSQHQFRMGLNRTPNERRKDRRRAELALGRPLKRTEQVHHHADTQLVICQDRAFHALLHTRTLTVRAGGNPNKQRYCPECKTIRRPTAFDSIYGLSCSTCVATPPTTRGRLWAWRDPR